MKLVIVGGVAAGASAATRARRISETAEIALFERSDSISFANCGLPYHVGGVIPKRENLLVMTPERLQARARIDARIRQEVVAIDRARHTVRVKDLVAGREYDEPYDKLILASGAEPVPLNIPGHNHPSVSTFWTLRDMDRVNDLCGAEAKTAVVVGAGFVGLEVAESLAERGLKVTLIELATQILPPMDPEMTVPLVAELRRGGVEIITGVAVEAIEGTERPAVVRLGNGQKHSADVVVLCAGVRPNTALARSAGLDVNARGALVVDRFLRTSDPDIYAAGDAVQVEDAILGVPTWVPLAGPANKQGRIAADNALGASVEYKGAQATSVVKVLGLTAAATGASEKTLCRAGRAFRKIYLHPFSHATYYPGAKQMHMKFLFDDQGAILGAQVVGVDGVEKRIDVLATAMRAGLNVRDLCDIDLAYAPPYSSAKDPVNFAGYVASNVLDGLSTHVYAGALPAGAFHLDVREPEEFEAGHIPGAINIPLGSLRDRLHELPRDRLIVVNCAVGLRAYLAERVLLQTGFKAANLSGGYLSWRMFQDMQALGHGMPPPGERRPATACAPCGAPVASEPAPPVTADAEVNVCGMQCPGPLVTVRKAIDGMSVGQVLKVAHSEASFTGDLRGWCASTGHVFVSVSEGPGSLTAWIRKGAGGVPAAAGDVKGVVKRTSIVLFSGDLDKAMAALIIANGFAALGHSVSIFCTFWGLNLLRRDNPPPVKKDILSRMFGLMLPRGASRLALSKLHMMGAGTAMMKYVMNQKRVANVNELMLQARAAGVKFLACEMAMNVMGITPEELVDGCELAGVGQFAALSEKSGPTLFI